METRKPLNPDKKRYATYLRPQSIKDVRRYAFERDVPDYHVVQAAIDAYLGASAQRPPVAQARMEW